MRSGLSLLPGCVRGTRELSYSEKRSLNDPCRVTALAKRQVRSV